MPRNRTKFNRDIKDLFEKASKEAFLAGFRVKADESDTPERLATRMSKAFSSAFAKEVAPKLGELIDKQLDDQLFDVSKLTSPAGPVTGVIKSV